MHFLLLLSLFLFKPENPGDKYYYVRNYYPVFTSLTLKTDTTFIKVINSNRGTLGILTGRYYIFSDTLQLNVLSQKNMYTFLKATDTFYVERYKIVDDSTLLQLFVVSEKHREVLGSLVDTIINNIPPFELRKPEKADILASSDQKEVDSKIKARHRRKEKRGK
jgi:hypothetical protein